ncbi:hypothetical protein CYMTET_11842 [Cymbomonas tetramitiformis]|uniref:Uncharacterized protein n=1 Tax=Cymbomonas tetramitiformis TaxID=36881 RepID=A0AAE0GLG7_9CHLO|nr:hypothetical protein CYMTET_11842 [Cymbomonas tetramitiformis]
MDELCNDEDAAPALVSSLSACNLAMPAQSDSLGLLPSLSPGRARREFPNASPSRRGYVPTVVESAEGSQGHVAVLKRARKHVAPPPKTQKPRSRRRENVEKYRALPASGTRSAEPRLEVDLTCPVDQAFAALRDGLRDARDTRTPQTSGIATKVKVALEKDESWAEELPENWLLDRKASRTVRKSLKPEVLVAVNEAQSTISSWVPENWLQTPPQNEEAVSSGLELQLSVSSEPSFSSHSDDSSSVDDASPSVPARQAANVQKAAAAISQCHTQEGRDAFQRHLRNVRQFREFYQAPIVTSRHQEDGGNKGFKARCWHTCPQAHEDLERDDSDAGKCKPIGDAHDGTTRFLKLPQPFWWGNGAGRKCSCKWQEHEYAGGWTKPKIYLELVPERHFKALEKTQMKLETEEATEFELCWEKLLQSMREGLLKKEDDAGIQELKDLLQQFFKELKGIFRYYCMAKLNIKGVVINMESVSNVGASLYTINRDDMIQLGADCKLYHHGFTLAQMDLIFLSSSHKLLPKELMARVPMQGKSDLPVEDRCMLLHEFCSSLVRLGTSIQPRVNIFEQFISLTKGGSSPVTIASRVRTFIATVLLPRSPELRREEIRNHIWNTAPAWQLLRKAEPALKAVFKCYVKREQRHHELGEATPRPQDKTPTKPVRAKNEMDIRAFMRLLWDLRLLEVPMGDAASDMYDCPSSPKMPRISNSLHRIRQEQVIHVFVLAQKEASGEGQMSLDLLEFTDAAAFVANILSGIPSMTRGEVPDDPYNLLPPVYSGSADANVRGDLLGDPLSSTISEESRSAMHNRVADPAISGATSVIRKADAPPPPPAMLEAKLKGVLDRIEHLAEVLNLEVSGNRYDNNGLRVPPPAEWDVHINLD